jgi:hypothetical protein
MSGVRAVKRLIRVAAICAALGVGLNIVVAWRFAKAAAPYQSVVTAGGLSADAGPGWFLYRYEGPGSRTEYGWPTADVDAFVGVRLLAQEAEYPGSRPPTIFTEEWSRVFSTPPALSPASRTLHIDDSRGWPFLSLRRVIKVDVTEEAASVIGRTVHQGDYDWDMSEFDLLRSRAGLRQRSDVIVAASLPMRPSWPGFMLNSAIYAAACGAFAAVWVVDRHCTGHRFARQALRLIMLLVLGVAITACVAAAIVMWAPVGSQPKRYMGDGLDGSGRGPTGWEIWSVERNERRGATRFESEYVVRPSGSFVLSMTPAQKLVPSWAADDIELGTDEEHSTFFAVGWPWRAFHCRFEGDSSNRPPALIGGIRLPSRTLQSWPATSMLIPAIPYQPIWMGLLADTAFYGATFWLLVLAPGGIKRAIRRRRGRCMRCGYDLRGLDAAARCPECGASGAM